MDALGRYVSIDLMMTDGTTTLRGTAATDVNGVSMHPATGRGTVGSWTKTTSNIGLWLNGKTIDKILVAYDNGPSTGDFSTYMDDIAINEQSFSILPLKLLSFTAKPDKNNVLLHWQTAFESDIRQYEMERSSDGINFSKISTILPVSGTGTKNYNYNDADVLVRFINTDHLYYRLKVTDLDGKYTYSNIQVISTRKKNLFIVDVMNPFTDKIGMSINAPGDGNMNVFLTDISGKIFINTNIKVQKGLSNASVEIPRTLAKGTYIIKLTLGRRH